MKHRSKDVPDEIPQAHGVGVFFCDEPDCKRPHVMLYDEHDKPLAHFVVPDEPGFMAQLGEALERSQVERYPSIGTPIVWPMAVVLPDEVVHGMFAEGVARMVILPGDITARTTEAMAKALDNAGIIRLAKNH